MSSTPIDKCDELKSVLQFIDYSINYTSPIAVTNMYGYCPLPSNIVELVRNKIYNVTCGGEIMLERPTESPQPAPGQPEYEYDDPLLSFSGLTTVPYVPFYNYLGSTISASQASTFQLSTLSSLYNDNNTGSFSSSLRPSFFLPLLSFLFALLFQSFSNQNNEEEQQTTIGWRKINRMGALGMVGIIMLMTSSFPLLGVEGRTVGLGLIFPFTGPNAEVGIQMEAAARAAIAYVNPLDPSFNFTTVSLDEGSRTSLADAAVIYAITRYFSFSFVGGFENEITAAMASLSESYLTPMLSANARANVLSDGNYPLFSRVVPAYRSEGYALATIVEYYGWGDTVATIASSDDYGVGTTQTFIATLNAFGHTLLSEERYFLGATDFSSQLSGVRDSLARVIVVISSSADDTATILSSADDFHLVGDQFIWMTGTPASSSSLFMNKTTSQVNNKVKNLGVGMFGLRLKGGYGEVYETFLDNWQNLSSITYSGAGKRSIAKEATYAIDSILLLTTALKQPFVTLQDLLFIIRNTTFTGLTGPINLNGTQDRLGIFEVMNLIDNNDGDYGWVSIGDYYEEDRFNRSNNFGLSLSYKPMFHDGSYTIPSLIIHNKLTYWSCEDREMKTDETGKEVRLDEPGPDAKNIDKQYRCDQFIDCYNMSDEWECSPSLPAAYIAIGIILALSIFFALFCLIFTVTFGYIFRRRRIRTASPLFLMIIAISCIVGFGSDYAYFGQDSKVSCPFRMWLVTLAIIVMISSLFIKSFRVWRLYRAKSKIVPMPDWQLIILVILMVIPVLIIDFLWTLIATPTASLIKIGGEYHYVCHAGGFTGDPIGYVFFAIDCAYIGLILLFGVFLSIVTRNIISTFNESRLIAVSVRLFSFFSLIIFSNYFLILKPKKTYNLFFLGVIGIPVYLVIYQSNPLAAWVIYEVCVLYGFLSTLAMQFIPKIYGIIVVDKFKNTSLQMDEVGSNTNTQSSDGTNTNPNALF